MKTKTINISTGEVVERDMTVEEESERETHRIAEGLVVEAINTASVDKKADDKLVKALKKALKPYAQRAKNGETLVTNDVVSFFNDLLTEFNK